MAQSELRPSKLFWIVFFIFWALFTVPSIAWLAPAVLRMVHAEIFVRLTYVAVVLGIALFWAAVLFPLLCLVARIFQGRRSGI